MNKKILIITNSSSVCFYFRGELIKHLQAAGFSVAAIVGDGKFRKEIASQGVDVFVEPIKNRSLDLVSLAVFSSKISKIIAKTNPCFVFSFQTKAIIACAKAIRKSHTPCFAFIEGFGDAFSHHGLFGFLLKKGLIFLLKKPLKSARKVFALNHEDVALINNKMGIDRKSIILIHGTGVDCWGQYAQKPFQNFRTATMVSRLLINKGVFTFCEAARICKKTRPDLNFILIGKEDEIRAADIQQYIDDGSLIYKGAVGNLNEDLSEMSISVVPTSYNEGMPRAIMEAMAIGRPVITTKRQGCNFAVVPDFNGEFVEERNPAQLAQILLSLFSSTAKIEKMGMNARKFAEIHFSSDLTDKLIIEEMLKNLGND